MTPDFEHRTVAGTATLRFAPIAKPLESLRLDGVNLRRERRPLVARGARLVGRRQERDDRVRRAIPVGEEAWVEIDYSAEPIEGLYFRTPAMGFPEGDDHCWTQGETHEARHWFPCFDYPNERSSTELICHVPADMTVVSNGRLVDETTERRRRA